MNGLPVVNDRPRVLTDQVIGDFERAGGAGLGVVLEHLAPTGDAGISRYLNEDPGVFEHEGLNLGDLDLVVRANQPFCISHVMFPCVGGK